MVPYIEFKHYESMILEENLDVKGLRETAMSSIYFQVTLCYGELEQQDAAHWKEHLDKVTVTWEKSHVHEKLVSLLEKCNLNYSNKIICSGLGCLSRDELRRQEGNVPTLSQGPSILDAVNHALKPYGFTFYEGPGCTSRGFIDMDGNTFVISISPTVPFHATTANIARPAILLCDGYLEWFPPQPPKSASNIGDFWVIPRSKYNPPCLSTIHQTSGT
ncbi:hypothetical protein DL767_011301 [Monosporascus sp. MG133]|nr:hypothetical protein DL767_011301 [Monosporascus sp. MG133]